MSGYPKQLVEAVRTAGPWITYGGTDEDDGGLLDDAQVADILDAVLPQVEPAAERRGAVKALRRLAKTLWIMGDARAAREAESQADAVENGADI